MKTGKITMTLTCHYCNVQMTIEALTNNPLEAIGELYDAENELGWAEYPVRPERNNRACPTCAVMIDAKNMDR